MNWIWGWITIGFHIWCTWVDVLQTSLDLMRIIAFCSRSTWWWWYESITQLIWCSECPGRASDVWCDWNCKNTQSSQKGTTSQKVHISWMQGADNGKCVETISQDIELFKWYIGALDEVFTLPPPNLSGVRSDTRTVLGLCSDFFWLEVLPN